MRADYLRSLAGENIPKPGRERVRRAVRSILDDPGRYNTERATAPLEEQDPDDLFDPDEQDE